MYVLYRLMSRIRESEIKFTIYVQIFRNQYSNFKELSELKAQIS